jgi:hypothetical protein
MTARQKDVKICLCMETLDKFKLALGTFWAVFTLYGIFLLFPPMDRRLREWEARFKQAKGMPAAPSRPQRVVFLLLSGLMTAVILADAFHRNFDEMTGISSGTVCLLMMILPGFYFILGKVKKSRQNGHRPEA